MTIDRLFRTRHECDNPTRILTVGEVGQALFGTEYKPGVSLVDRTRVRGSFWARLIRTNANIHRIVIQFTSNLGARRVLCLRKSRRVPLSGRSWPAACADWPNDGRFVWLIWKRRPKHLRLG